MSEKNQITRLDREISFAGSILDFCTDTVRLPDGVIQKWDFVHHRKGRGACIVPVLPDGRILLVRQYRPALGREFLELPAGGIDPEDPDALTAAKRELSEETGYGTADANWSFLARVNTAVAYCDEYTDLFLAKDIAPTGAGQHLDEGEAIALAVYEPQELLTMIREGSLTDGKTVAGILAYRAL